MGRRISTLTLLAVLFVSGCPQIIPDPKDPDDPPPPAPVCDRACDHYRSMECEEGEPTPEGRPCEEVCNNLMDSEVPGMQEYYECVLTKDTCPATKECD